MTLINLIVLIIICGVVLWGINSFIPMAPLIKGLLNFVVLIVLIIYVLQFFGLIHPILPNPNIFK